MESSTTEIIEESVIIRQVEKICSSAEFNTKDLLCRFLSYIISEYLEGRGDSIKGYTIGVDVFNRGEDFDPGQDALVRINAGRLRRALDMYYLKEGINDKIKIEIPKGGYNPQITLKKTHQYRKKLVHQQPRNLVVNRNPELLFYCSLIAPEIHRMISWLRALARKYRLN
ncbi:hypothetical protein [uncultured Draconibacterium sp.]|uniref:hypothetical protein n=1 Tax=uncultured Draconibacterium sp. TaxID=1573823 RepID=UPI0025ECDD0E|nr:hypothetical protein [uncultured Draconibacterium sp.]